MILAARSRIEGEPEYTFAAARLLLRKIYREALPTYGPSAEMAAQDAEHFARYLFLQSAPRAFFTSFLM